MLIELKKSITFLISVVFIYTSILILLYLSLHTEYVYFIFLSIVLSMHGYFFINRYVLLDASSSIKSIVVPHKLSENIKLLTNTKEIHVDIVYSVLLTNAFSIIVFQAHNTNHTLFISYDILDIAQMCHLKRYLYQL